jgi:hypothetical protein
MDAMKNWFKWMFSRDRRSDPRQERPRLLAYYWDGGTPKPHALRDVSSDGLYLLTPERWYPGTLVMVSLHKIGADENDPDRSITVNARVVRLGDDGVGLELVPSVENVLLAAPSQAVNGANRKTFRRFLQGLLEHRGQALIEYILLLPLLFLLIVNVVNLGGFFFAWITVANAARSGANYAVLGGASVGSLHLPSATQVTSLITGDISSLPNRASLAVNLCRKYNGIVTTLAGTCT